MMLWKRQNLRKILIFLSTFVAFSTLLSYRTGISTKMNGVSEESNYDGRRRILDNDRFVVDEKRTKNERKYVSGKYTVILHRLKKIEERLLGLSLMPVVVISDGQENMTEMVRQLTKPLNQSVRVVDLDRTQNLDMLKKNRYSILVNTGRQNKLPNENDVGKFQKMNYIPALRHVINDPHFLCTVMDITNGFQTDADSVKCTMGKEMLNATGQSKTQENYHQMKGLLLNITSINNVVSSSLPGERYWMMSSGLVGGEGYYVMVRVNVLVAAFLPLRLYIDHTTQLLLVDHIHGEIIKEMSTVIDQIGFYITKLTRIKIEENLVERIRDSILTMLISAEYDAWLKGHLRNSSVCSCPRCFDYLSIDFVIPSSLLPVAIKITEKTIPDPDKLGSIWSIVGPHRDMSYRVAAVLDEVESNIAFSYQECEFGHSMCLSDQDLVYLIDYEREKLSQTSLIQIFPGSDVEKDEEIFTNFRRLLMEWKTRVRQKTQDVRTFEEVVEDARRCHPTVDVISLIREMKRTSRHTEENNTDEISVFTGRKLDAANSQDFKTEQTYTDSTGVDCEPDDSTVKPFLRSINFTPRPISLEPAFNPYKTEYMVTIPYDVIALQIVALPIHCVCKVAADGLIDGSGTNMSFTFGLGESIIHMHVMDGSDDYPRTLNIYTLIVKRLERGRHVPHMINSLHVCEYQQDCTMKFIPAEKCGLATTNYTNWKHFEQQRSQMPSCSTSNDMYKWYVPCKGCDEEESCNWKFAQWHPAKCRTNRLMDKQVQRCFADRKILFIGDSTNRGIFHYIMEKVNGTLIEWEKTHETKLYPDVNRGRSFFGFAYYPKFWMDRNHRPPFNKSIYQLIKQSMPLENNHNTVIVVGGTLWLSAYHLHVIKKALHSVNLTNVLLISKGLGSGFHRQINGIYTKKEQYAMHTRETNLLHDAEKLGFRAVPTFNMTMSRYRDFLQGKCACHFHNVDRYEDDVTTGRQVFHIVGDINAAYSELVINEICLYDND